MRGWLTYTLLHTDEPDAWWNCADLEAQYPELFSGSSEETGVGALQRTHEPALMGGPAPMSAWTVAIPLLVVAVVVGAFFGYRYHMTKTAEILEDL